MKRALFYCFALIAMSFSFIVPAQASGGHDCSADHAFQYLTLTNAGELASIIGPGGGDPTAIGYRSVVHQLEAAELMAYNSGAQSEVVGLVKITDESSYRPGPFEVAWQS